MANVIVDGRLERDLVWKTTFVGLRTGRCTGDYNDGKDSTQVFLNASGCGGHDDGHDEVGLHCNF